MFRLRETTDSYGTTRIAVLDDSGAEVFRAEVWEPALGSDSHQVTWPSISRCDAALAAHVASAMTTAANIAQRRDEQLAAEAV